MASTRARRFVTLGIQSKVADQTPVDTVSIPYRGGCIRGRVG